MDKPLVLVVDDEVAMADMITEMINESAKYKVITAYSAKEALEYLANHKRLFGLAKNRIGCIILDIKMPEMDGLQFLEKIRKEMLYRIPVVIVSAYEDGNKWLRALDGEVAVYLKKPVQKDSLLATIDNIFAGEEDGMIRDTWWDKVDQIDATTEEEK